ncbi:Zinc transporter 2 [Eumeta japonica]|uniref:Zinc transporter 2 n=1 Tax=Eumeta variegata TaxID=151549 RepID=A0A4C1XL16_EUMVA|nr:Zinc transporter 2 [Eumeta japonica]
MNDFRRRPDPISCRPFTVSVAVRARVPPRRERAYKSGPYKHTARLVRHLKKPIVPLYCSALSLARSAPAERDNESCFFVRAAGVHRFMGLLANASGAALWQIQATHGRLNAISCGYLSNSLAIATDAAHLLTDFASFMISLFALWVASRPATRRMPFGWYRAEVIGALVSVLLIWVVTGILVYMAVQRVIYRQFEIDATVMLITSAVGVVVNLIMGLTLHQHGHSHGGGGGGHSHGEGNPCSTARRRNWIPGKCCPSGGLSQPREYKRASCLHPRPGDFLQSFGVLVAAIVIYFKPSWDLVDPICTFLFSILVLLTTFNIIKDALLVLMEGSPRGLDFQDVANTFLSIPGVVRVHNLRMWALSLDKTALAAHLAIHSLLKYWAIKCKKNFESDWSRHESQVLDEATRQVHDKYNFFEMTLQIEEFNDGRWKHAASAKCRLRERRRETIPIVFYFKVGML